MSNWQHFNLDAPEFVPNFGGGPSPNQNRTQGGQGMPHQMPPGVPPMYGGPAYGAPQQPIYPQQQPQFRHQNYQQQYYYQQQPQFNNLPPNVNPALIQQQFMYQQSQAGAAAPFMMQQQQSQQQQSVNPPQNGNQAQQQQSPQQKQPVQQQNNNNNTKNTSDSKSQQVNQLTTNLSKLSTNETTTAANPTTASPIKKPEPEPESEPEAQTQKPAETPAPSNEQTSNLDSPIVEKSVPPSVSSIKESEEWEDETGDDDATTDKAEEAQKKPKKAIVIREYKPRKEPINVIFCGHVDAGKSTIGGQIMFLTGMVDKRTLEKYEREAKEKNRESWYLSWALDTNMEEREKGKTVEVGRAFFETEKKHFIILDAPGHRGFVPNMIGGASQADIAVLVISARKGEFETGFERGGQTREHAMLVKTAGVKYLVVLVNKMDDSTVNWDQTRYDEIKDKLTPYLKKCGFQPGKDTYFMPCSGFTGAFIKEPVDEEICPWYRGPCFIEYLDNLPTMNRTSNGPVRMPLIDKYKDMGTVVSGKIESGMVKLNDKLLVMPNKIKVEVVNIYCEDEETDSAICGENVKLKLKGIEEEEVTGGSVLCDLKDTCQVAKIFDAQVVILECPSIICPGFNSIMHIHAGTSEVQLTTIIGMVDKKSGEKDLKNRPRFIKQDQIAICRFEIMGSSVVCMEKFKEVPQLGRFTLRYENKTIAVGKVLKIVE